MSEADLLWECIMIRDKVFQMPDWFMPSNVCQTFFVASDLLCFYCIFLFCVLFLFVCILYCVFNFLHCFTGQKLMLLGRCILSILLFPFIL